MTKQLTLYGDFVGNKITFEGNKLEPIHRWVKWIAGFSSDFVSKSIITFNKVHKKLPSCIIDPFAGVGTTLLEAKKKDINSVGFEINPYAWFIANIKINSYLINLEVFSKLIKEFKKFFKDLPKNEPNSKPPITFKTRIPFYSPIILRKVLLFFDYINMIENEAIKNLFLLAFSSKMVSFSNYTYEPSLGTRPGAQKPLIKDADVGKIIVKKLEEMYSDIKTIKKYSNNNAITNIYPQSFFSILEMKEIPLFDLLITSPPYMNNYHYTRNTRPQMYWLNLIKNPEEQKEIEMKSFGKFWQNVRALKPLELQFKSEKLSELIDQISKVNTEKKIYGGVGWANYVITYFNDSFNFFSICKNIMAPICELKIVIGNSIIQGINVPCDRIFVDIAEKNGFQLDRIETVQKKRIGNSIIESNVRNLPKKKSKLYESVLHLYRN